MPRERQLLTIGHSYVVAGNRLLAHELAACGAGRWRVTAIAPSEFRGDLRRMRLEPIPGERCEVRTVRACFDRSAHFMWYAGLRRALAGSWDIVHCWEEPYVHVAAQIAGAIGPHPRLVFSTFQNISKRFPWPVSRFERESMRRADGSAKRFERRSGRGLATPSLFERSRPGSTWIDSHRRLRIDTTCAACWAGVMTRSWWDILAGSSSKKAYEC